MLGIKLVRLIEKHAHEIAETLVTALRTSERTYAYRRLSEDELRQATLELYAHLGEWLLNKSAQDVERYFTLIGARRAAQGIPPSQLTWALFMSKAQLASFIYGESAADRVLELYSELELIAMLDGFFDRAVFYALLGYEHSARAEKAA
ncbi:MAG TPA: RsbRD N-terminal domain-containing protein [candidate division Zixibacteria bacterium]|nr:RsbRD N-terminal domain-containing protein [candidate division Zixibacteria bacterium]